MLEKFGNVQDVSDQTGHCKLVNLFNYLNKIIYLFK